MPFNHICYYLLFFVAYTSTSLAQTTHFECSYPVNTSLDDNNTPEISTGEFKISFLLDGGANKAYIIGNGGVEEVSISNHSGGISFIEITATGNVSITTITSNLKSVHSRNTILTFGGGEPDLIPSQYYGACKKKQ